MYTTLNTLTTLIDFLDSDLITNTNVIRWGSPVPSFGDISRSQVATLGLNPSNREFVDKNGNELRGSNRRLHTLDSLGIDSWSDVDARHLRLILESCNGYFMGNPYDRWFKILDYVISDIKASYYDEVSQACHLDLIPYATNRKWVDLDFDQRSKLLSLTSTFLGLLLRDSPVKILILNGKTVVDTIQNIGGIKLEEVRIAAWSLRRRSTQNVPGIAYQGIIKSLSGVCLGHDLLVLGFNHNLQGSYGVTSEVLRSIRLWISQKASEVNL